MSPLLRACARGHTDVVRALLAAGANCFSVNLQGHTIVHLSSQFGHISVLSVVLTHLAVGHAEGCIQHQATSSGTSPTVPSSGTHSGCTSNEVQGCSERVFAEATNCQTSIGNTSVAEGVKPHIVHPAATPCCPAAGHHHHLPGCCLALVQPDMHGHNPLHLAARWNMPHSARMLLDCVVPSHCATSADCSDEAADSDPTTCCYQPLLDVNDVTLGEGLTASHLAARWGHADVLKLLAERSADFSLESAAGRNVLHEAQYWNRATCVEYLNS